MAPRVCIVGGGIVGLSTARVLLETQPGIEVVVIAENFSPDTTSNVAAGLFRPGVSFSGPTREITVKWLQDSLTYIRSMISEGTEKAKSAGIINMNGYVLATESEDITKNHFLGEVAEVYRECTKEEIESFSGGVKYGTYFESFLIDNAYHLPYLMKRIEELGGKLEKRSIHSFAEIADEFDVICNCTGLGARKLCNDHRLTAVRGQVFKVKAPWIKNFTYVDYSTYIIPGIDYVTLGGTRQYEDWNLKVDRRDGDGIWERCLKAVPSLKDAEIVKECVGLRPHRHTVRVEQEIMTLENGKKIKVVHNYGHGGYGVMSAPGTAMHAAQLVQDFIISSSSKL